MILRLITCLIFISLQCNAQVAVSYFPFESYLGISSNTERLFWVDYKLETNTFVTNLNMEFSPKFNLIRQKDVNLYTGPGISFNPINSTADLRTINGYFIDLGVRVKPIANKNAQLVFEISPYINHEFNGGNLRSRLGIAYNFIRKKNSVRK